MFINEKEKQLVGLISAAFEIVSEQLTLPGENVKDTKVRLLRSAAEWINDSTAEKLYLRGEETTAVALEIVEEVCHVSNQ